MATVQIQNPQAIACFNAFQTALNQHRTLSRPMVLQVAAQTLDTYFQQNPTTTVAPMAVAGKTKTTSAGAPVQWSRLLNTKEYGLPAFFQAETVAIKAEQKSINYFTLVKQLRDQFEGTPRWTEYVEWVKTNHPQGPSLKDPSPRKSASEAKTVTTTTTTTPITAPMTAPMLTPDTVAPVMATLASAPVAVAQPPVAVAQVDEDENVANDL